MLKDVATEFVAGLARSLLALTSRKFLLAVGSFATLTALKQYTEAAGVVLGYLGINGATAVVAAVTKAKTDTATATATIAVAAASPVPASAAADVADTLTQDDAPDITRDDVVAEAPDAPEEITEPEPVEGF